MKFGDGMTVHYLPKLENPEAEWICPQCDRKFIKTTALSADGRTASWELVE